MFTDSRGARRSHPNAPAASTVDIVAVGGSFTWGHGVESDETFVAQASVRLGLSAANLAVPSYGTVGAIELLRRNRDLSPRFVVYGFIRDHIRRNLSPCAPAYSPFCRDVPFVAFNEDRAPYIEPPPPDAALNWVKNQRFVHFDAESGLSGIGLGLDLLFHKAYRLAAVGRRGATDPWRRSESMRYLAKGTPLNNGYFM